MKNISRSTTLALKLIPLNATKKRTTVYSKWILIPSRLHLSLKRSCLRWSIQIPCNLLFHILFSNNRPK